MNSTVAAKSLSGRASCQGDQRLLQCRLLGLFCSKSCPGSLILCAHDLARELHVPDLAVVGGFHTPVEKECLRLFLRGGQPVIVCPARGIEGIRLPADWKVPLAEGRLLLASPFGSSRTRVTRDNARLRNEFVASLADKILVIHAAPGSKTMTFCRRVLESGKPLLTLESPHNEDLIALGARTLTPK